MSYKDLTNEELVGMFEKMRRLKVNPMHHPDFVIEVCTRLRAQNEKPGGKAQPECVTQIIAEQGVSVLEDFSALEIADAEGVPLEEFIRFRRGET